MDSHGPIAQRFPLVARFRPACPPLPERVHALVDLADTAARTTDQGLASAVYNQSALIASDVGLPELAREMCHQHADAYLHACPLPGISAIRGLEPIVNLARLQIRAGNTDDGRQHLLTLYEAVSTGASARFDDVEVPAHLTATPDDRQEVRAWLWRVLLADGTRTLTAKGRWGEALAYLEEHRGVGKRMLDGRQVAVLAALTNGDAAGAANLLDETVPADPREESVTACLTVLCHRALGRPVGNHVANLIDNYVQREAEHGMTVFDIRLGLTILNLTGLEEKPAAYRITEELHRRTIDGNDGYAARECLAHHLFCTLATEHQVQLCRKLVRASALGSGALPNDLGTALSDALQLSNRAIRASLLNETTAAAPTSDPHHSRAW